MERSSLSLQEANSPIKDKLMVSFILQEKQRLLLETKYQQNENTEKINKMMKRVSRPQSFFLKRTQKIKLEDKEESLNLRRIFQSPTS